MRLNAAEEGHVEESHVEESHVEEGHVEESCRGESCRGESCRGESCTGESCRGEFSFHYALQLRAAFLQYNCAFKYFCCSIWRDSGREMLCFSIQNASSNLDDQALQSDGCGTVSRQARIMLGSTGARARRQEKAAAKAKRCQFLVALESDVITISQGQDMMRANSKSQRETEAEKRREQGEQKHARTVAPIGERNERKRTLGTVGREGPGARARRQEKAAAKAKRCQFLVAPESDVITISQGQDMMRANSKSQRETEAEKRRERGAKARENGGTDRKKERKKADVRHRRARRARSKSKKAGESSGRSKKMPVSCSSRERRHYNQPGARHDESKQQEPERDRSRETKRARSKSTRERWHR